MSADLLIVTCSQPDALPFLRSLPASYLAGATVVATGDVVHAVEKELAVAATVVIAGFGALDATRGAIGERPRAAVVVVGPDPWGPFHGKGFVRARLLTPRLLAVDARADLVELRQPEGSLIARRGLSRRQLTLRLYAREALLLTLYLGGSGGTSVRSLVRAIVGILAAMPLAAITTGRVALFVVRTESQARQPGSRR